MKVPNPLLRSHVSDHSFVLTLRRTHIEVMNIIAHNDYKAYINSRHFVNAGFGCIARGLVQHLEKGFSNIPESVNRHWRLTKAGWAAFDLLVEAGLASPVHELERKVA